MPTALELKPIGWQPYLKAAKRTPPGPLSDEAKIELDQLLAEVREAAVMLKLRFGVKRVWVFGSLVHQAWFDSHSDVDIAVAGLSWDDYWEAWEAVENLLPKREVDLVRLESISERFAQAIHDDGLEL